MLDVTIFVGGKQKVGSVGVITTVKLGMYCPTVFVEALPFGFNGSGLYVSEYALIVLLSAVGKLFQYEVEEPS